MKKVFLVLFLSAMILILNVNSKSQLRKSEITEKIQSECKQIMKTQDCYRNKSCGWCAENNSCVAGNKEGPLSPCNKTSFYFSENAEKNWSPQTAASINIHTSGKFVLTEHPDLNKIYVDKAHGFRKNGKKVEKEK